MMGRRCHVPIINDNDNDNNNAGIEEDAKMGIG